MCNHHHLEDHLTRKSKRLVLTIIIDFYSIVLLICRLLVGSSFDLTCSSGMKAQSNYHYYYWGYLWFSIRDQTNPPNSSNCWRENDKSRHHINTHQLQDPVKDNHRWRGQKTNLTVFLFLSFNLAESKQETVLFSPFDIELWQDLATGSRQIFDFSSASYFIA